MTSTFSFESCVRGYHVCKDIWIPVIGETLTTKPKFGNPHDPYAVAVVTSDDTVVGLYQLSAIYFYEEGGIIIVQIIGRRKRSTDLPQGGLEVPCSLTFVGVSKELAKIEKLTSAIPADNFSCSEPPQKRAKIDIEIEENESCAVDEGEAVWLKFDDRDRQRI